MNQALLSSNKTDWCTPQDFYQDLDAEFHFVGDVAASDQNAKAPNYYTPETDGLSNPWNLWGGAIWCNPPYGKQIGKWVQKAYEESLKGTTIVMLIPARTDTSYFHNYVLGKAEIRFIRGRLWFTDEHGNRKDKAPFPSMLVIYNSDRSITS